MGRIGIRHCTCCGAAESHSGCVHGPTCRCDWDRWCAGCLKCEKHCTCEQAELYRDYYTAADVRIKRKLKQAQAGGEVNGE